MARALALARLSAVEQLAAESRVLAARDSGAIAVAPTVRPHWANAGDAALAGSTAQAPGHV